jgi:hypothetical protein
MTRPSKSWLSFWRAIWQKNWEKKRNNWNSIRILNARIYWIGGWTFLQLGTLTTAGCIVEKRCLTWFFPALTWGSLKAWLQSKFDFLNLANPLLLLKLRLIQPLAKFHSLLWNIFRKIQLNITTVFPMMNLVVGRYRIKLLKTRRQNRLFFMRFFSTYMASFNRQTNKQIHITLK